MEIDGTPRVPVKPGVGEARGILQSRPFGEGRLQDVVSLARADQSVVRPHRNPSPLPLLDDFRLGFDILRLRLLLHFGCVFPSFNSRH